MASVPQRLPATGISLRNRTLPAPSFSEVRAARVFALLDMALHDAAVGCWDTKYIYFNPRPEQMDPDHQDGDWPAQLPVVRVRPFHVLGSGGYRVDLPLPERQGFLRCVRAGSRDIAAVWRHSLPGRQRSWPGPWHADRRLYREVRPAGWRGPGAAATSANTGQTLDGASFHSPVAPGSIATVFQTDMSHLLSNVANSVPLPTSLSGVSMKFNGSIAVPLFATTQNQANIQIPWELQGLSSANLTTIGADGSTATFPISLARIRAGDFQRQSAGNRPGAGNHLQQQYAGCAAWKHRRSDDAGGHERRFHHHLLRRSGSGEQSTGDRRRDDRRVFDDHICRYRSC